MARSTSTSLFSVLPNRNTTRSTSNLCTQNSINRYFIPYRPPFNPKVAIQGCQLAVKAVSSSQEVGSLGGNESTIDLLDKVQVFDLEGNGVPITDLWKDRKAIVAFARHFGCVFCRKRADYLASKQEQLKAAGVALVLIGPGSIDQGLKYAEGSDILFCLQSDEPVKVDS